MQFVEKWLKRLFQEFSVTFNFKYALSSFSNNIISFSLIREISVGITQARKFPRNLAYLRILRDDSHRRLESRSKNSVIKFSSVPRRRRGYSSGFNIIFFSLCEWLLSVRVNPSRATNERMKKRKKREGKKQTRKRRNRTKRTKGGKCATRSL